MSNTTTKAVKRKRFKMPIPEIVNPTIQEIIDRLPSDRYIHCLIDLFAGFGGVTEGALESEDTYAIAAVNHDMMAITSHYLNHPYCMHFREDIKTLILTPIIELVNAIRQQRPLAKFILWASLECTNFSKAKGGMPKKADSRTLADHLDRYYFDLQPDAIFIENVEEFLAWGPLDDKGKPISKDNGIDFQRWRDYMKAIGSYRCEHQLLNAADYGAVTSRKRLFIQFAKQDFLIVWPEKTHYKKGSINNGATLFSDNIRLPWRPVREVLNLDNLGVSIFCRYKELCEKTIWRLYKGLIKALKEKEGQFISTYHGNGTNAHLLHSPSPTLPTKDSAAIVSAQFIMRDFTNGGEFSSLENPAGSIMGTPKMNLVTGLPFIVDTQFNNNYKSLDEPAPTQTANRKHFYLINPQFLNNGSSINDPCFTLIARMDKAPPHIVCIEPGQFAIEVYKTDSEIMCKLKKLMADNGIKDLLMRMLDIEEMLRIQGLPDTYKMVGNKTDQKKMIGNCVEKYQAKSIFNASLKANRKHQISIAA